MKDQIKVPVWLLTGLRILIGWHFLYEGIIKLASPSWSAGPYLLEATWVFSGIFKALALNHSLLTVVDFLNIWGLIFIGAGLLAGLFTRVASWSGVALLMLYYLARPPFVGIMDGNALEVVKSMEANGFPVDFHFKTFHDLNYWSYQPDEPKGNIVKNIRDNYWCREPEETAKYMETVNKPWIAFKILAAGAIKPEDGFKYAFEKGADFACVGLFDYQVVEDCNILTDTLKGLTDRKRKFF